MTKFQNMVEEKSQMLDSFFLSRGYEKGRNGKSYKKLLHKQTGDKLVRYRLMPRVVRYEVYGEESKTWFHIYSANYADITLNENNKLTGFR